MNDAALQYLDENQQRFIDELCEFLRFPSVSAQKAHDDDMRACAAWLRDHFAAMGLQADLVEGPGHPIVTARTGNSDAGRIIIYGHYDVQPPDPLDEWHSAPFEPRIDGDVLIARGASDDKGQFWAHVKAVEALMRTDSAPDCEILFLVEGEEESGGKHLANYLGAHATDLARGLIGVILSDNDMPAPNQPAITYALRGMAVFEVTVRTLERDVHSGTFGGVAGNPIVVLSRMLAESIGPDGRVHIPGFYDRVRALADWEKQTLAQLRYDESALAHELGTTALHGETGFDARTRVWARPTFEVNGMWGGYIGHGSKTIIPAQAAAKITMRLVPDQDPTETTAATVDWFKQICPAYARCRVDVRYSTGPVIFDVNTPLFQQARDALAAGFGHEPVFTRCGVSIPVVETFWKELHKPVVQMALHLAEDGAHAPNERFRLEHLFRGARSSAILLSGLKP